MIVDLQVPRAPIMQVSPSANSIGANSRKPVETARDLIRSVIPDLLPYRQEAAEFARRMRAQSSNGRRLQWSGENCGFNQMRFAGSPLYSRRNLQTNSDLDNQKRTQV